MNITCELCHNLSVNIFLTLDVSRESPLFSHTPLFVLKSIRSIDGMCFKNKKNVEESTNKILKTDTFLSNFRIFKLLDLNFVELMDQ